MSLLQTIIPWTHHISGTFYLDQLTWFSNVVWLDKLQEQISGIIEAPSLQPLITEGNNEATFQTCSNFLYGSTLVLYGRHPIQDTINPVTSLCRSKVKWWIKIRVWFTCLYSRICQTKSMLWILSCVPKLNKQHS